MSQVFPSLQGLTKSHEGSYLRFDGLEQNRPARKSNCLRLNRVWSDGINVKRYGNRPQFIGRNRYSRRVEVFTPAEFEKLPE